MPVVSSTEIRKRLLAGESAQGMVSANVQAYIREHGLYAKATG
jgi:nicotinic acid mononucleotide adenylyltransferase